jgi:endonuclease/exonuclease/phosphatase family metal-dependent hydrolase
MTYNVHSCKGTDGKLSVERIAQVIIDCSPDVACLQELDVGRWRTGTVDQALKLADILEMEFHFHPALNVSDERYGDAILSRQPLKLVRAGALPSLPRRVALEPRGALWVLATVGSAHVQIINTHLGMARKERGAKIDALMGTEWLGHERCRGPVILCGDFNALPCSPVYRHVRQHLRDAQHGLRRHRPRPTFPSRFPLFRIDHVFVNDLFDVQAVYVPRGDLARMASDHLPLIVDLRTKKVDG